MLKFDELVNENDKSLAIDLLRNRKEDQWNSQDLDKYWHTTRILQSLTFPITDKRVFVHVKEKIKVIVIRYGIREVKEMFEVWGDNLSGNEIDLLSKTLIQMTIDLINEDKTIVFRCLSDNLAQSFSHCLSEFRNNFVYRLTFNFGLFLSNLKEIGNHHIDGFELGKIPIDHVDKIIEYWKYANQNDEDWMKRSFEDYPSLGIYDLSTQQMIGHFIYTLSGTVGCLHIDPKYRGRGLGKMLISGLAKLMRERNMNVLLEVVLDNTISKSLFEKLDFETASQSFYLIINEK